MKVPEVDRDRASMHHDSSRRDRFFTSYTFITFSTWPICTRTSPLPPSGRTFS